MTTVTHSIRFCFVCQRVKDEMRCWTKEFVVLIFYQRNNQADVKAYVNSEILFIIKQEYVNCSKHFIRS